MSVIAHCVPRHTESRLFEAQLTHALAGYRCCVRLGLHTSVAGSARQRIATVFRYSGPVGEDTIAMVIRVP
jgi:hypothetical protein